MSMTPVGGTDSVRSSSGRDAALIGASNAFNKERTAPGLADVKGDAAFIAATRVGPGTRSPLNRTSSDSSTTSSELHATRAQRTASPNNSSYSRGSNLLEVPSDASTTPRSRSPSNIAATLAVARYQNRSETSRSTSPAAKSSLWSADKQALLADDSVADSPLGRIRAQVTMDTADGRPDERSIPPTNSLVKLFEQNNATSQRRSSVSRPKPQKPPPAPNINTFIPPDAHGGAVDRSTDSRGRSRPDIRTSVPTNRSSSTSRLFVKNQAPIIKSRPDLPAPRRTARKAEAEADPVKSPEKPRATKPKPAQSAHLRRHASNPALTETFNRSLLGPPLTQYQQKNLAQISPHITGDSLANAIVGANLASLGSSPSGTSTPGYPARANRTHHEHHLLSKFRSRSNSPVKAGKPIQLRTTMRKEAESDSDEGRGKRGRGRKHYMRKHPNKHHEGSRKRWRDRLTEQERKRYEGVWAANKGLYVHFSARQPVDVEDDVLDIVVKDIWSRSRLPAPVLEEIWSLVDRRGVRRLSREEFVVGMWLIDQYLKGRKVPARVMDSVWVSVRLMGIKVKKKNFQ